MKLKKSFLLFLSIFLTLILMICIPNRVKASEPSVPTYFGISLIRTGSATNLKNGQYAGKDIGYAIGDPKANTTSDAERSGAIVWNIMQYPSDSTGVTGTKGNFYCVREGAGFTNATSQATIIKKYNNKLEVTLNNESDIKNAVQLWKNIDDSDYRGVIALANLFYTGSSDAEKIAFLNKAGINTNLDDNDPDSEYSILLTDDDIKVVQQVALWYYTNKHDQTISNQWEDLYDYTGDNKTEWLKFITADGTQYQALSDYDRVNDTNTGKQVGSGIERLEQANILYRYLISKSQEMASDSNFSSNAKIYMYTNVTDGTDTQPIIYIEPDNKNFDLALRKYITSVDGKEPSNARKVEIDTTDLDNGTSTTATYKHRKDPVSVQTGSKVVYNLTVYNEGDIEGRATKITDQLPTGLKFTKVVSGNFEKESYDTSTNRLILKRKSGNEDNLEAYSQGDLKSETVQIECEVVLTAGSSTHTLTNVAWISEEYNAESNTTITNGIGQDRDSEPSTAPDVNKDNMSNYTGNNNKSDLSDSDYYYKGQQDDDDFEKLELLVKNTYNLVLVKQDSKGEDLDSTATFEVTHDGTTETKTIKGRLEIAKNVEINSSNVDTDDVYTIKETVPPDSYCKFNGTIKVTVKKKLDGDIYKVNKVVYKVYDDDGNDITESSKDSANAYLNDNGNIYVEVKDYQFDLKLIKRIVEVNGTEVPNRIKNIDITNLQNGTATTADYDLNKNPVSVKKGDIVKYTLRVYNEGEIDGYAQELTEDIPEGLEFIWSEEDVDQIKNNSALSDIEKEAIIYNQGIWDIKTVNSSTQKVEMITTNYLAKNKGVESTGSGTNLIKAFDKTKNYSASNPDYKEVSVYMKVVAEDGTGGIIRNEAEISDDADKDGNPVDDRDSKPEEWKKYEDDEDYDNVVLHSFDLALRKFIIAVSDDENVDDSDYLKNSDGKYSREPVVDSSKLDTKDDDGKTITTAIYNHTKDPVVLNKNDYVIYMLRVYNEGDTDGYAAEITDHLPEYLEFVDNDFNKGYGWTVSSDDRTIKTTYLKDQLIKKYQLEEDSIKRILSYKEVPIMCRVKNTAQYGEKITNIAEISKYEDSDHNDVDDRDSVPGNVVLPDDKDLPDYKDDVNGDYIPGQEDDDDFEKVIIEKKDEEKKRFDLALRKFITMVNDESITTRIPQVNYNKDNNQITYEHTKDPVEVVTNDIVTYTIRVFNEGEMDGFASKISDDLPDGLEYLPDNETNKEYRWVMYDSNGNETTDVSKAVKVTTDYLSKEQGESRMKSGDTENPALLTAFDGDKEISETNPDYADVKIAFKVVEPNGSSKILVNSAQITDDQDKDGNPVDDDDSTPDKWIDGEDDQDKEYVKLTYFDLSLRKWVTQAIVIEDGKETVTQTGHKAEDNPEQVVKVELNRKKLTSVTVKFRYSIRVTNEGDIAGYAKQIKDYIPDGLTFISADNPQWTDEGNNVISTRQLENTLLQPGQSAEIEVLLTWKNDKNNLGLKTNTAEISEDYNDKHVPDRDSTPNNKKPGEDDIDDAPVLLSISTGRVKLYLGLGLSVLVTIAGGITLIKKFIL